ncbi:hypothetical protein ABTX71_34730 [Streptomyces parvulus]|uniref:hypothetical protein n=1 Tax=Streptomyces parvulus TaxID=146923 RepID=UPI0033330726
MSGAEEARLGAQESAPPLPLTDDEYSVGRMMAAMLSLEDDLTLVASLNRRLATEAAVSEAELGKPGCSG